jgi:predicted ATPase
MLTDATIKGLRGVGRVELHFDPERRVYTLFGVNGVGKTKCLEAIYQLLLWSNKHFWAFCCKHPIYLYALPKLMEKMRASLRVKELADESAFDFSPCSGDAALPPKFADHLTKHEIPVIFLGAGVRAELVNKNEPSKALGSFEQRRQAYFSTCATAIKNRQLPRLGMDADSRAWFVQRAQAVNRYQAGTEKRVAEIDTVLTMLHEIEASIDPESLRIGEDGETVFLKVADEKLELGELSSGFASLLKMMQAIVAGYAAFTNETQLRNVRGVVLIDEIESHLHASWQSSIIPKLKKLLPNTTFYIATHSPLVLAQLLQGEAYLLKREADGVVRSQPITYPNRRLFDEVLEDATGVDLTQLKLKLMDEDDQSDAKKGLLDLLDQLEAQEKAAAS